MSDKQIRSTYFNNGGANSKNDTSDTPRSRGTRPVIRGAENYTQKRTIPTPPPKKK
ncbi:hypothetical protein J2TS6_19160 [Paenibacillus albilobatus]|uniref:Uncharacterized protein n=1 Tax=Paenibacillus albilobatus TaxID=2716884 RepID=A0A920C979_9BACL|nr:hypothetical protein J2TS6_19160 [Paenibacillus albilobatus]